MHLSIVHKESVDLKEETLIYGNKPSLPKEQVLFQCNSCDSKFETEINLNQHNLSDHKKTKLFKCDLCDYSSSQKGNLKIHFVSGHEEKRHLDVKNVVKALLMKQN